MEYQVTTWLQSDLRPRLSLLGLSWRLRRSRVRLQCRGSKFNPWVGGPLEERIATHSSALTRRIPWTEEPGGLQSMGSQGVGHDRVIDTFTLSPLILTSEPVSDVSSFERRERSHFNNISDTDVSKSHDVKKKKWGLPLRVTPGSASDPLWLLWIKPCPRQHIQVHFRCQRSPRNLRFSPSLIS